MVLDLKVYPLSSTNWADLLTLFGKSGGNSQCWCLAYRFRQKELSNIQYVDRSNVLHSLLESSVEPLGLLGFLEGIPVGWVGFGPRKSFTRITHSRVIKPFDNHKVWIIVCFYFHKHFRGKKLIYEMIKGVIEYAHKNNIPIVEAYPIELTEHEWLNEPMIWFGTRAIFESLGFIKVGETSATSGGKHRVIMRYYTT